MKRIKLVYFASYLLLLRTSLASSESDSGDVSEEEQCKVLPAQLNRTSVHGENSVEIVNLLNGGTAEMNNMVSNSSVWPEEATLILGNTGSGKTTLTQILAGDLSRLHAVETQSGQLVIIDDDEKVGAPSTTSRTLVPELVTLQKPNESVVYFYDCPGFDDTRGPEHDLAANFFINQIVRNVARVKLLFLVTHSSMQLGNDRLGFDLLANHATTFVKNKTLFQNSTGLVVTKVSSYNERHRYLKDSKILSGVYELLRVYRNDLQQKYAARNDTAERETISRKIDFVDILLQPKKVSLSRSPTECGPLNRSDVVKDTKERLTTFLEGLEYSPVGHYSNFGHTLKAETVVSIHRFTTDINNAIATSIEQLAKNVSVWLDEFNMTSLSDRMTIGFLQKNKIMAQRLSQHEYFASATQLINFLEESLRLINFNVTQEVKEIMSQHDAYLLFFDEASGSIVQRDLNLWLKPVMKLRDSSMAWSKSQVEKVVQNVNRIVSERIQSQVSHLTHWIHSRNNSDVKTEIQFLSSIKMVMVNADHSYLTTPARFANMFMEISHNVGPKNETDYQTSMETQESLLDWLDQITEREVFRNVTGWRDTIHEFQIWCSSFISRKCVELADQVNHVIFANFETAVKNLGNSLNIKLFGANDVRDLTNLIKYRQATVVNMTESLTELPSKFASDLVQLFHELGIEKIENFEENVKAEEVHLVAISQLEGGNALPSNVSLWRLPILNFKLEGESWKKKISERAGIIVTVKITGEVKFVLNDYKNWFVSTKLLPNTTDIDGIVRDISTSNLAFEKLTPNDNLTAVKIGSMLSKVLLEIGYPSEHSLDNMTTSLLQINNDLSVLESELKNPVFRNTQLWWSPVLELKQTFQLYLDWYKFCNKVQGIMSTYEFQNSVKLSPVIAGELDFLSEHNIVEVTEPIKEAHAQLLTDKFWGKKLSNILPFLLNWYLGNESYTCAKSTLTVTGNNVRFSYFLNSQGFLKFCETASTLKIYAFGHLFIDRDLNAVGKEMLVYAIASVWHVEGCREIKLDGRSGSPQPQGFCPSSETKHWETSARNTISLLDKGNDLRSARFRAMGNYLKQKKGNNGRNGEPGNPGGPGGSFFGRASRIENPDQLTIFVNGGNGGDGENGCDGQDGSDGDSSGISFGKSVRVNLGIYENYRYCRDAHFGWEGGAGGHGGARGTGGKPGTVDIGELKVKVKAQSGLPGNEGLAGKRGKGGQGDWVVCCRDQRAFGNLVSSGCALSQNRWRAADGKDGVDGVNGGNNEGRQEYKMSRQLSAVEDRVKEYQSLCKNVENLATKPFAENLK